MKLTILQKNIHQGLNTVSHVAGKNINMPILNNILITAQNGLITLAATNLEIGITRQIRGKIDQDGQIIIDSKILSDYIALLPNEKINLNLDKQDLKISCQKYKTVIKGQDPQDFPVIPNVEKKINLNLKVNELKTALNQVLFAINPTDNRLELTGVLFDINKDFINLVATDSFRLAKNQISFQLESGEINQQGLKIIIPFKTIQELSRIINTSQDTISLDNNDQVQMFINDNQVLFIYQETEMVSRVIEGNYPDYYQVMPSNFKTEVTLDRQELSRAIKMAAIFSSNITNAVDLIIDSAQQKIIIEAVAGQVGSHQTELPVKISGENNSVRLNYRYLLDCLNILPADQIAFKLINDTAACQLSLLNNDNYQYIIVPLRK